MSRFDTEFDFKDITYENIPGMLNSGAELQKLIPSIQSDMDEIVRESFPTELRKNIKLIRRITKGGNNDIYIYQSGDLTIVVRLSKYASFQKEPFNHITVLGNNKNEKINNLNEAIQSKSNWERANSLGYTPKLYNYGYLENNGHFYNYIICEKMESDLSDYYETGPGKDSKSSGELSITDYKIARQLVDLLYATTNNLGLICFDIKPANCMINYSDPNNIVVKLIDWDGDWCQDYSYITSKSDLKDLISILSVIVMAAHFYVFLDWNIFYTYFSEPDSYGNFVKDNQVSLQNLFCDNLTDSQGNKSKFDFFQKHYFQIMDKDDNPATCEDAFNLTFTRAHYLNRATKRQATRQPVGVTRVGGRKKTKKRKTNRKKTNRRKKNKKRKTKSKK
jgi:hypothetical protein|uniref:Protein kinase domain-containing protein n=1 Tax=viral metagenome TaxID=1070528 RepID=A0A6C0CYE5_9ZZZZ